MKAILLVDHGSVREAANHMIECVGQLTQARAGDDVIVRVAHMELARPTIAEGFSACVDAGATEVVAFPYMLSPGKHSTRDIPRMVSDVAAAHPEIPVQVTSAFGVNEQLAAVVLEKSGVTPAMLEESRRCAHPRGKAERYCGDGCPSADAGAPAR